MVVKKTTSKVITKKHLARIERERIQRRNLLIGAIIVAVLVVGVIAYGVIDQVFLQALRPVAKVDSQVITSKQFETRVRYERYRLVQRYSDIANFWQSLGNDPSFSSYFGSMLDQINSQLSDPVTFGTSVLDQMIKEIMIEREAKTLGITVSEVDVDKSLKEAMGYFPNGTPTSSVTPTGFSTATLSSTQYALISPTPTPTLAPTMTTEPTATQAPSPTTDVKAATSTVTPTIEPTLSPTPYTLEGFQNQLKTTVDGLKQINFSESDLRNIVRNQLLYTKVFESTTGSMKPEQEQVWARHILVADEAAAKAVIQRLAAGEDFAIIAAEVSTDTGSKTQGGDLGWFGRGTMAAPFEESSFSLETGKISQPIQSEFGWHVIQVLGHEVRPLNSTDFAALKTKFFNDLITAAEAKSQVQKFTDLLQQIVPVEPVIPPGLLVPTQAPIQ